MFLDLDLAAFKNMLALDITLSSTLANIDARFQTNVYPSTIWSGQTSQIEQAPIR
jgi:hypothetical protein